MRRRDFIKVIAGSAASWPLTTRAQQTTLPVVAFINGSTLEASARRAASFRTGLSEVGFVEGRNVVLEYHWLEGHYDRLPTLMANLVHRGVAVIATPGRCTRGDPLCQNPWHRAAKCWRPRQY
jgi:putative ABC transport system substrate-binding protein